MELVSNNDVNNEYLKDLQEFKALLKKEGECLSLLPFTAQQTKVNNYKRLFISFALLFLFFAGYIGWHIIISGSLLPFGHYPVSIPLFLIFSLGCSAASLVCAFSLKPEFEALRFLLHAGKTKLRRAYAHRKMEFAHIHLETFEKECSAMKVKHAYQDSQERLDHLQEEASFLLKKINSMPFIHAQMRERLLNQTLLELKLRVERCVNSFEAA